MFILNFTASTPEETSDGRSVTSTSHGFVISGNRKRQALVFAFLFALTREALKSSNTEGEKKSGLKFAVSALNDFVADVRAEIVREVCSRSEQEWGEGAYVDLGLTQYKTLWQRFFVLVVTTDMTADAFAEWCLTELRKPIPFQSLREAA